MSHVTLAQGAAEPDAARAVVIVAALGGIWALVKTFLVLLRPAVGSAAWARTRIRKL